MIHTKQAEAASAVSAVALHRHPNVDLRSLSMALAGTFVLRCASYGAGTVIPISLGLKSHSDPTITANLAAFVSVTFYAAELVGAPIFGALSDRLGRRLFMMLGAVFGGVAIQLLGITAIIPMLALVRILEGLSTASAAPSTLGYLSAQTAGSERLRGRVMGFYEAATVVGLASGAAIAGRLYEQFGSLTFTLIALIYALSLILFVFVRDPRPQTPGMARHGDHGVTATLRRLFHRRIMRFAPAWLAANAILGAWLNISPFLASTPPDPSQYFMQGYTPGQIGTAFLFFGVLFTAGAIAWGFVMPRIGRQATLLIGVTGLAWMAGSMWLLNKAPVEGAEIQVAILWFSVGVGIFVESGFTPAALAYLAEIAEEHAEDRGSVMGVYSVLLSVGQLSGTALAGPFSSLWAMEGLILLTGLLTAVAAFTVMLLGYTERREARAKRLQSQLAG